MEQTYPRFLTSHSKGRLATIGSDGGPLNKPVGYQYGAGLGTVDIGGYSMQRSATVSVLAPAPGVAVAQIRRTALGDDGQPGEPAGAFSEMPMYVLVRRDGTRWPAAGQNTPVGSTDQRRTR